MKEARARWQEEFAAHAHEGGELGERMFFILDEEDRALGTATAWYDPPVQEGDAPSGRVHWVAMRPEAQGKGLAKPLLAHVLRTLQSLHPPTSEGGIPPIRLITHCQAARAIGMYLEVGFVPAPLSGGDDIQGFSEAEGEGWQMMAALGLPIDIPGTQLD